MTYFLHKTVLCEKIRITFLNSRLFLKHHSDDDLVAAYLMQSSQMRFSIHIYLRLGVC